MPGGTERALAAEDDGEVRGQSGEALPETSFFLMKYSTTCTTRTNRHIPASLYYQIRSLQRLFRTQHMKLHTTPPFEADTRDKRRAFRLQRVLCDAVLRRPRNFPLALGAPSVPDCSSKQILEAKKRRFVTQVLQNVAISTRILFPPCLEYRDGPDCLAPVSCATSERWTLSRI